MWEVSTTDPDKIFNWIRTNGESIMNSETPGPEFDHDNNRTRFFMFTDKIDQKEDYESKEEIFTTITSPVYSAKDFPLECFTFYYFFGVNSTQCGNFMILLSLRFYVKSNLRIIEVQNLPFLHI